MPVHRHDLYAALGLTPSATQGEIRRAYRSLLRQNHPDTHSVGDREGQAASTATLQDVIAAYAVLGDPARRTHYDSQASPPSRGQSRGARAASSVRGREEDEPPIQAGPVRWHRAGR